MISKIWMWIAGIVAAIGGFMLYGSKKKSEGKDEAKNEQQEQVLDNVKKAKESDDDSASMSEHDRIERMRERARDNK